MSSFGKHKRSRSKRSRRRIRRNRRSQRRSHRQRKMRFGDDISDRLENSDIGDDVTKTKQFMKDVLGNKCFDFLYNYFDFDNKKLLESFLDNNKNLYSNEESTKKYIGSISSKDDLVNFVIGYNKNVLEEILNFYLKNKNVVKEQDAKNFINKLCKYINKDCTSTYEDIKQKGTNFNIHDGIIIPNNEKILKYFIEDFSKSPNLDTKKFINWFFEKKEELLDFIYKNIKEKNTSYDQLGGYTPGNKDILKYFIKDYYGNELKNFLSGVLKDNTICINLIYRDIELTLTSYSDTPSNKDILTRFIKDYIKKYPNDNILDKIHKNKEIKRRSVKQDHKLEDSFNDQFVKCFRNAGISKESEQRFINCWNNY